MMNKNRWRRIVLLLGGVLAVTSIVGAGVYSGNQKLQKEKPARVYKAERVTAPPTVSSKVKALEIAGYRIVDEGTPTAALSLDVINNSDQAVTCLDFTASDGVTHSGLKFDGLLDAAHPLVAIPPHSLKTFRWHLSEIIVGQPVFISAATFADGGEDGDPKFLDGIHKTRAHFQREAQRKGGQQ